MKPELHMGLHYHTGVYARAFRRHFQGLEAMDLPPEVKAKVLAFHGVANGALSKIADELGTTPSDLLTPNADDPGDDQLDSGGTDKP